MLTRAWTPALVPALAPIVVAVLALVLVLTGPGAGAVSTPTPLPTPVPAPTPAPVPTPTPPAEPTPVMTATDAPAVRGEARWTRTVRAFPGRWTEPRVQTRYRWLRDGRPIRGARDRRYRIQPQDVGARLSVQVRVRAAGTAPVSAESAATLVRHRVPVRRVVTYHLETRGDLAADLGTFARLAQETFEDPRGWRNGGVELRRVRRGGHFSLVLAEASWLPRFSSGCSSTWSCRVGRHVVINQTRWLHASPAWNAAGRSLRDYRHMVVNHETGHWLGRGHRGCPGRGRAAPVMMQQSKGTAGCRFNPWPTGPEL